MSDADVARRAVSLLDLTELGDDAGPAEVARLCNRAVGPAGVVAAVCVWPRAVSQARELLDGTGVRAPPVVTFPAGGEAAAAVAAAADAVLADGADEVDVVLPYRALQRGDDAVAGAVLEAVRDRIEFDRRMKVILETGELPDAAAIARAARFAIEHGADFVKTSTGKTPVSATPEAVAVMLDEIRASGRPVGIKPSGGIRTLDDARTYLDLADRTMGPRWATPATFRFGASGLLDALLAVVDGHPAVVDPTKPGY